MANCSESQRSDGYTRCPDLQWLDNSTTGLVGLAGVSSTHSDYHAWSEFR